MTEKRFRSIRPYPNGLTRVLFVLFWLQVVSSPDNGFGMQQDTTGVKVPLRLDPVEIVVSDLDRFIPEIMNRDGIPGLSIALIREHKIVWEKSYGVANTLTREPLTTETALPMASIGKPIVAMTAMSLVENGTLTLDGPLGKGASSAWLRDSGLGAQISLRHVLTHTSGLSNFLGDQKRTTRFPPGGRFSYSGVGFMYLQHVLETLSNAPLDSLAGRKVFQPLGMTHSWYGRGSGNTARGNGHISFLRAIAPFGMIFIGFALVGLIIGAVVYRYVKKSKTLRRWLYLTVFLSAVLAAWWFLVSKASDPNIVPFFVGTCMLLLAGTVLTTYVAAKILQRLGLSQPIVRTIRPVIGFVLLGAVVVLFRDQPVPVPDVTGLNGNAASSLHSTAGDIARFAIALSGIEGQTNRLADQMIAPQIPASQHLRWGLGVGIEQSGAGTALFHWGRNPSMRAAFVLYRKSGIGAVVVVNLGDVGEAVSEVVSRAVGGPLYWANE